jgi:hypothetical protein
MSILYTKRKNNSLFTSLEKHGYLKPQNYIPTHKNFFVLNETNYNSINISGNWFLKKIHSVDEDGFYSGVVENLNNSKTKNVDIFIKNAPLLDPVKFMIGAYQSDLSKITNLPVLDSDGECKEEPQIINKINDPSNSSYVDNLFNIINSQLLEKGFIHGIEWYGSFLAVKKDFKFNIYDDLDYLFHSKYFLRNVGSLFHVPKEILDEVQKPSLKLEEDITEGFDDFEEIPELGDVSADPTPPTPHTPITDNLDISVEELPASDNCELIEEQVVVGKEEETLSNSSYSSRTSYTNEYTDNPANIELGETDEPNLDPEDCPELVESYSHGKQKKERGDDEGAGEVANKEEDEYEDAGEDDDDDGSMGSSYDDEYIEASIPEFPVQMICIEACDDTLDSLMLNDELSEHELFSCMMQIIMILATYQKLYKFTHNDLHTNNVMFVETNKKYIRYEYNGEKYLVPTYGKIYKIIDFGRSIFTIGNQVFCGDCYQKNGDAYSQYNFGPCLNEAKPPVEPNYSFDMCRLACSMFDHCISNISEIRNPASLSPFKQLVVRLCTDDKGLNVLYKKNHEERYPCFKLYKMIARTVHNHTPDILLDTRDFKKYVYDGQLPAGVSKKDCYEVNVDKY